MNPDSPGEGPFYDPDGCGNGPTMFFMSIGVELGRFGCGQGARFGEFWSCLAISGHFGSENFSKCEKSATYFSVRIFSRKIFLGCPQQ